MNQCVPSWGLSDSPNPPPNLHPSAAPLLPMYDSEVEELTWENGHLTKHGLRHGRIGRPIPRYPSATAVPATWDKVGPSGTLESIVDQATRNQNLPVAHDAHPNPDSWPGLPAHPHCKAAVSGAATAAVDALVPCADRDEHADWAPDTVSGRIKRARVGKAGRNCTSQGSSAPAVGRGDSTLVTLDTWEMTGADDIGFTAASTSPDDVGFTTTSASPSPGEDASPDTENTSFGSGRPLTLDEHDSVCHSRILQPTGKRDGVMVEQEEKVTKEEDVGRSFISTKRSRAAAVHNQSERKRRDRINQRMKTLQKLVPNSSKTDKASMLDEVIEYLKQLQAQVQMMSMSRMNSIPHMMMPMAMPQLQMPMLAHMAQMARMGMGMGMGMMDLNPLAQPGHGGMPGILHPSAFLQQPGGGGGAVIPDPFSAFLACQTQQPVGMDAYNRMAALYQQLYQQAPPANPKT